MSETTVGHIAVLGCGGWGTALAVHLSSIGQTVRLWGRDRALIERMVTIGTNEVYLPGVLLPPSLCPTADLEAALYNAQYIVVAVPSHGTRETMNLAAPHFQPQATIVSAVKGLEETTLLRMSKLAINKVQDEQGFSSAMEAGFADFLVLTSTGGDGRKEGERRLGPVDLALRFARGERHGLDEA